MPLPALGLKSPWAARKAGPRYTKRHYARQTPLGGAAAFNPRWLMAVPGVVFMAVPERRLMLRGGSCHRSCPCPAWSA
jgi:hypothetical protein